ncbi:GNAT family N-acetyltransferase [Vibrio sp. WXL210]|uniref:GNAT family N-acetyltransferase n=1 Tax=Vibrio sp. WXL210 TaxID=3450709 RepID=UPI003EC88817
MHYRQAAPQSIPLPLLLEADPDEQSIDQYLDSSQCYCAALDDDIIGVVVLNRSGTNVCEILNVAVNPDYQAKGVGTQLLQYTLEQLTMQGIKRVELGTGTFGYQLTYYQRLGFRVDRIEKDHFVNNYPEPIWENGIRHFDMLRLYINL